MLALAIELHQGASVRPPACRTLNAEIIGRCLGLLPIAGIADGPPLGHSLGVAVEGEPSLSGLGLQSPGDSSQSTPPFSAD